MHHKTPPFRAGDIERFRRVREKKHCIHLQNVVQNRYTVGHTEIHAWGNRVRRQVLGCGAVVVEPRIPRIYPWGVSRYVATTRYTLHHLEAPAECYFHGGFTLISRNVKTVCQNAVIIRIVNYFHTIPGVAEKLLRYRSLRVIPHNNNTGNP